MTTRGGWLTAHRGGVGKREGQGESSSRNDALVVNVETVWTRTTRVPDDNTNSDLWRKEGVESPNPRTRKRVQARESVHAPPSSRGVCSVREYTIVTLRGCKWERECVSTTQTFVSGPDHSASPSSTTQSLQRLFLMGARERQRARRGRRRQREREKRERREGGENKTCEPRPPTRRVTHAHDTNARVVKTLSLTTHLCLSVPTLKHPQSAFDVVSGMSSGSFLF